jgi:hypothetical protein
MAITTKRNGPEQQRGDPRSAHRREMVEGLLLLAVLIVLAIVAKVPTG